jgi:ionotropic glutamate receptor NMDA 2B
VSVEIEQGKPNMEFTADGVLKAAELKIMNLRPGVSKQLVWEEVRYKFTQFIIISRLTLRH